jgi:hypothetical protein
VKSTGICSSLVNMVAITAVSSAVLLALLAAKRFRDLSVRQQLHKRDSRIPVLAGEVRQLRDRDGLVVVGASVTSREPNFIDPAS